MNNYNLNYKYEGNFITFSDWDLMQANHIRVNTRDLGADKPVERIIMEFEGYILGYTETGMRYAKDRIDIAIGKYSKLEEKGFTVYYFPEDSIGANIVAESVQKVYSLYNKWFGEKAFSDYSIVEIPDGFGSQTDVSCILQTSSAFKDPDKLYELHHELFHTWDIPSNDKIPCRMESEGLATFIQAFVDEKVTGDVGLLDKSAQKTFERLKNKFASDTMLAQIPMADFGKKQMTTLSYTKGMLFFYLLYKMVGEEAFTGLIRDYYTQFRPKGATTEDFSNFLITRFKNKKVESLVNDWIRTNASSKQILAASSVQNLLL